MVFSGYCFFENVVPKNAIRYFVIRYWGLYWSWVIENMWFVSLGLVEDLLLIYFLVISF